MFLKDKEREILKQLFKMIAKNPGINQYRSDRYYGIERSIYTRKISQYELIEKKLIRIKKEKYNAKNCFLTLSGLLLALHLGAIEFKEAPDIRKNHEIDFSKIQDPMGINPNFNVVVEDIEKKYPDHFYRMLMFSLDKHHLINRNKFESLDDLEIGIAAFIILLQKISEKDPLVNNYTDGKSIKYPDGTLIADDYEELLSKPIFKALLPAISPVSHVYAKK
jgi:hypothetical protein